MYHAREGKSFPRTRSGQDRWGQALCLGFLLHFAIGASESGAMSFLKTPIKKEASNLMTTNFTQVSFTFTNGPVTLAGTLWTPEGPGPFPAVVLVHGEGPEPRQPFGWLPKMFVEGGIAVLSYDKRGVGGSGGNWLEAGADLDGDVLAGVQSVAARPGIRAEAVGLCGISQAGWIMPRVASRSHEVAFIISVSGAAVSPTEQNRQRVKYELMALGYPPRQVEQGTAEYMEFFQRVRDFQLSHQQAIAAAEEYRTKWWFGKNALDVEMMWPLHMTVKMIRERDDILDKDPRSDLTKLTCPLLAIYGEKDCIVPPQENIPLLKRYLKEGGNQQLTVKIFPKANHNLSVCQSGTLKELLVLAREGKLLNAPGLAETMVDWVHRQVGKNIRKIR